MIEIKIRSIIVDAAIVEEKLSNKYSLVKEKKQVDEYFSHPCKDFYFNLARLII